MTVGRKLPRTALYTDHKRAFRPVHLADAHAVHAALKLYGIDHHHPVIVIGGKPDEILAQTVHVRDAGRTELEPGTLTAGASWEWKAAGK